MWFSPEKGSRLNSISASKLASAAVVLFAAFTSLSQAAVPMLVNYQGRLTNAAGQPVTDGQHAVSFVLYADSVTGGPVWAEAATVTTSDGLFTHLLGSLTPLPRDLWTTYHDLFLQLIYNGQALNPRTRLAAVPFALLAAGVEVRNGDDSVVLRTGLGPLAGGELSLFSWSGDSGAAAVIFDPDRWGDSAVILPQSSISSFETGDEPGFALSFNTQPVELTQGHMQDLVTVDIEAPADGYIILDGKCYVILDGTTGPNVALIQIDTEEGGPSQFPYYQLAGLHGYVDSGENYFPVYVTRIYAADAGEHTFRMEGRAEFPLPARARSWDHVLRAVFVPTDYGVASAAVRNAAGIPGAKLMQSPDPMNPDSLRSTFEIDLRNLKDKR